MSTELEQLLRGGMERFVEDVRLPPGLALRAYRHRRRQRLTARAVTAAGTVAAVTAVAVAGVTGAFGPGHGPPIRTAAYVTRVERALDSSGEGNMVEYDRTVLPPGSAVRLTAFDWRIGPAAALGKAGPGASAPLSVTSIAEWTYRGTTTMSAFSGTGQRVVTSEVSGGGREVTVIYRNGTWWSATAPASNFQQGPARSRCGAGISVGPGGWPAAIRQELSCGAYKDDGRQPINVAGNFRDVDAIKLIGPRGSALWINPATYLPVRQVVAGRQPTLTDFRWLPPTPANLAQLSVRVPAGFRQVPRPS